MSLRKPRSHRPGTVILLTAFLMIVMMAVLAMAVDMGYVYTVRSELQRSADAAAIAAAWELMDREMLVRNDNSEAVGNARLTASEFAGENWVGSKSPELSQDDVTVGYLSNPNNPQATIDPMEQDRSNAVEVRVRKTEHQNGQVRLFFAHALGHTGMATQARAMAAFQYNIGGFRHIQEGESNLDILPFALDEQTWDALMAGNAADNYRYDPVTKQVVAGTDGIKEVNLYPQGTGSPGNRGTVDIGYSNNSTKDISRQILSGISPQDIKVFTAQGRTLQFNDQGKLWLNGDTGISAGVKDELESIKGKPRIIPIFRQVAGNGNNAEYTIVKWAGVRIVNVKLTGSMSGKQVMVQPAAVVAKGTIPSPLDETLSYFVYSPPWLVR